MCIENCIDRRNDQGQRCVRKKKQPAVFQIEDDVLNISIRDKLADYQEQVPLQETVCKSIRLGFDSRLVLETLKAFTCDNIALGFTSPRTPMIVEAEDSDMKAWCFR